MLLTELGADPGAQGIMRHKEGFAVSVGKSLLGLFSWTQWLQEPQLEHAQKKQLQRRGGLSVWQTLLYSSCHPGAVIPMLKCMSDWQGSQINSPPG